jgi:hypothetical protein
MYEPNQSSEKIKICFCTWRPCGKIQLSLYKATLLEFKKMNGKFFIFSFHFKIQLTLDKVTILEYETSHSLDSLTNDNYHTLIINLSLCFRVTYYLCVTLLYCVILNLLIFCNHFQTNNSHTANLNVFIQLIIFNSTKKYHPPTLSRRYVLVVIPDAIPRIPRRAVTQVRSPRHLARHWWLEDSETCSLHDQSFQVWITSSIPL